MSTAPQSSCLLSAAPAMPAAAAWCAEPARVPTSVEPRAAARLLDLALCFCCGSGCAAGLGAAAAAAAALWAFKRRRSAASTRLADTGSAYFPDCKAAAPVLVLSCLMRPLYHACDRSSHVAAGVHREQCACELGMLGRNLSKGTRARAAAGRTQQLGLLATCMAVARFRAHLTHSLCCHLVQAEPSQHVQLCL
jgi:hypothetical protein